MIATASALNVRVLALALALLGLGACTHSASETFEFASAAAPSGTVHVETFDGAIRITESAAATRVEGTVRVLARGFPDTGAARAAAREVRVVETGSADALVLTVDLPAQSGSKRFEVDLDLVVPRGVAVSTFADHGPVDLQDVEVIEVITSAAPIRLLGTRGVARLRTEGGAITVEAHSGNIDARTFDAPMALIAVVGEVDASTTNGFIEARVSPPPGGEIALQTLNAGVDLIVPSDFGAQLVVATSPENAVTVDLPRVTPTFLAPGQFQGIAWNGGGLIDVRTLGGDVVVADH